MTSRAIREMIAFGLLRAGFDVHQAPDAEAALAGMFRTRVDLLLVDWMLSGMNGLDLLIHVRTRGMDPRLPIIMLSARVAEDDKVTALNHGADDYITKPFALRELLARVRAVMRRHPTAAGFMEADGLSVDTDRKHVSVDGRAVSLRPAEYLLLSLLMSHRERVFSREQLLGLMGALHTDRGRRNVNVHVRRLRHALEPFECDRFIQTVHGSGYRFSIRA